MKLRIVRKGGPGSGNFAHLGRPGKVGGSAQGYGGLRYIGLDKTSTLDDRDYARAQYHRRRAEMLRDAKDVAKQFGFPPSKLTYGGKGYTFKVGDAEYQSAGHYNPRDDRVVMFDGGLTVNDHVFRQLVAHEFMHARFHRYLDRMQADTQELNDYLHDNSDEIDKFMHPGGELMTDELKAKYPGYTLDTWGYKRNDPAKSAKTNMDVLKETDGVTEYSKSYWKAFEQAYVASLTDRNVPVEYHLQRALNETVAEIANLEYLATRYYKTSQDVGRFNRISKTWKYYYNEVKRIGSLS